MTDEKLWRDLCQFRKEFGYALSVFFVVMIHGVTKFANRFPAHGCVDDSGLFHEKENGRAGLCFLILLDCDGPHCLAEVLLKFAETKSELCERFMFMGG